MVIFLEFVCSVRIIALCVRTYLDTESTQLIKHFFFFNARDNVR